MRRSRGLQNALIVFFSLICFVCIGFGVRSYVNAKAEKMDITSSVETVETLDSDGIIILSLSNCDYMTAADWSADSNTSYKWVDALTYENRTQGNIHNALLDKNLSEYNYAENILLNGTPLSRYAHSLHANRFQRVNGFGIDFAEKNIVKDITEIYIKEGCTIPSLTRAYFGVEETSAIVIEEDILFRKKNGIWTLAHYFSGYEMNKEYDASEQYFYARKYDGNYNGHTEASTYGFTDFLAKNDLGDEGYALASTNSTQKGNLLVLDLVNPIAAQEFGTIYLRLYVQLPRTLTTYNANDVTEVALGEKLENISIARGWTTIALNTPLYADVNGMINTLVFQFTNDGHTDEGMNQVFIGSFSLGENQMEGLIYDNSLMIDENETEYLLHFRFNKKGAFVTENLDTSKVCVNGLTIDEINATGDYATAKWISIQGIYQINITLAKTYTGEAQLRNSALEYSCNKISVLTGLTFPNGDVLEKNYTYNLYRTYTDNLIYENEVLIEYGVSNAHKETKVTEVNWEFDKSENENLHFYIVFDQRIAQDSYYHACEGETWREKTLNVFKGMYDADFSKAYVAGGYKASLLDCVVINGKTLGDLHASNKHQTCTYVHYGRNSAYVLDVFVDKNSAEFSQLYPLFTEGGDVTLEIKSGFKFTTGVQTERDYVFVLQDGKFVETGVEQEVKVFFDGQAVENGALIKTDYEALVSSVYVDGVEYGGYEVTKTIDGDVATFVISCESGETFTFSVERTAVIATEPVKENGCGSSIASNFAIVLMAMTSSAMILNTRRKSNEENV